VKLNPCHKNLLTDEKGFKHVGSICFCWKSSPVKGVVGAGAEGRDSRDGEERECYKHKLCLG